MLQEQRKQFTTSDGVNIVYQLHRCPVAEHTLVMIHGLASNHTRWSEFVTHTVLSETMNLLRIDLRGHGLSMSYGNYSHERWAKDLLQVLEFEKLDKVLIVGHSLGAQTALHVAVRNQEKVKGLVLIDPVFPRYLKGILRYVKYGRYLLMAFIWMIRLAYRFGMKRRHYPLRDLRELDRQTRELLSQGEKEKIADLYGRPGSDVRYIPLANYLQDVVETVRPLPDTQTITCPVLLLLSKGSTIIKIEKIRQCFTDSTDVAVHEIQADHWPLTEKPDDTRIAIEKWCLEQSEL